MKKEEVPQDASALQGYTRELCYVKDEDGKFVTSLSSGWEVKAQALEHAWDEVEEQLEEARTLVRVGKRSPLYFFMKKNLMNLSILSNYSGFGRILVWFHLRPLGYRFLGAKGWARYAEAFNCSVEDLKNHKL
ncbi:hypothetical protein [Geofilum rhodophaeum]|uniref:hypothetical protein n=1 Tax=Geofilum rhodophaeum TaxID=1965019 RepID=UPI000B52256A|nr:hypothetical protein [Geofilum rhodophaeum]